MIQAESNHISWSIKAVIMQMCSKEIQLQFRHSPLQHHEGYHTRGDHWNCGGQFASLRITFLLLIILKESGKENVKGRYFW
jgi:hypothetical protein